jgi:hypothetical protein
MEGVRCLGPRSEPAGSPVPRISGPSDRRLRDLRGRTLGSERPVMAFCVFLSSAAAARDKMLPDLAARAAEEAEVLLTRWGCRRRVAVVGRPAVPAEDWTAGEVGVAADTRALELLRPSESSLSVSGV